MGRGKRIRPQRLGEKLLQIRRYFDWSLAQMAEKLSESEKFELRRQAISQFELNDNEPPIPVLLKYARLAKINLEILADDELNLPDKFRL